MSIMASVTPTRQSGAAALTAGTAAACARSIVAVARACASGSRTPGGNIPRNQPIVATTPGSFSVHAHGRRSGPSAAAVVSTKRAKRSAVRGSSHAPDPTAPDATQRGVVKWWKVTIGCMPRASTASHSRR